MSSQSFCNPNIGICRTARGIFELVLRALIVVLSIILFICACMTIYNTASRFRDTSGGSLVLNTSAGSGWLVLVSFTTTTLQIVVIVGRFLDCSCTVTYYTCFYALDICINFVMALFILLGAIAEVVYGQYWPRTDITGLPPVYEDFRAQVIHAVSATAAFGFLDVFVIIGLGVWMIISLCMKKASSSSMSVGNTNPV